MRNWSRWKQIQRTVWKRDGWKCLMCGAKAKSHLKAGQTLTIDHIIPASKDKEKWFDPENMRTLCRPCHDKVHGLNQENDDKVVA